jgi:hypothetical protein
MDTALLVAAAQWAGLAALAVVLLAFLGALVLVLSPTPTRGSPFKLPNGMPITMWTEFETKFLYEEIWGADNAYARGGIEFKEGAVVVDCGANIGMFSLFAAMRCRGDATILAFEPIPTTYTVLESNAKAANAGAFDFVFRPRRPGSLRILPFNSGLSDATVPSITFQHHPNLSIWSTADAHLATGRVARITEDIVRACAASGNPLMWLIPSFLLRVLLTFLLTRKFARTVPVTANLHPLGPALDRYVPAGADIDVLKVDVEGAEVSVLEGIAAHQWPRVRQVVLEVENFAAAAQVRDILERQGFDVTAVATEREKNPHGTSEVSMVYATRPRGNLGAASKGAGRGGGVAPTVPRAASPAPAPVSRAASPAPRSSAAAVSPVDPVAAARARVAAEQAQRTAERVGEIRGTSPAGGRGRAGSVGKGGAPSPASAAKLRR